MIGHVVVQHRAVEVVVTQTLFLARHRATLGRVDMHDAVGIVARRMNRAVNDEAGTVHAPFAVAPGISVKVDAHQVVRAHFGVVQAESVDQVFRLLACRRGDTYRDVVEDQLGPAQPVKKPITSGEVDSQLFFRLH